MDDNTTSGATEKAAHEQILKKIFSFKAVGLIIAVGIIVISVSKFVDSVSVLVEALPKPEATISAFDTKTVEQTLNVAKEIDGLCSTILVGKSWRYGIYKENYRSIDIELRNLLLRQQSRPLNTVSVEQLQLVIDKFTELRDRHTMAGGPKGPTREYVKEARNNFHLMFQQILYMEASKPKT